MRRLLVPLVGLLVLLGGCSDGDPEPKIAPTESSSAASSTSPSPSPSGPVEPSLPAEAEGEDAAAAEAFVRFYWEMVNYAESSGQIQGLSDLGLESCTACAGGAADIARIYGAGGSVSGGVVIVTKTKASPFTSGPARGFAVVVDVDISPQVIREPGKKPKRYSGGPNTFQFIVQREEAAWRIGRWDPVS